MSIVVVVLVIALVLFALGFVVKLLWVLAAIILVIWLVGFAARGAEGSRWYRF